MTWEIINVVLGLLIGLATGFYFERRATFKARTQQQETLTENMRLRAEIRELHELVRHNETKIDESAKEVRTSVYGMAMSGYDGPHSKGDTLNAEMLLGEIRKRLGVDGQASLQSIRQSLLDKGHLPLDFDSQLNGLVKANKICVVGKMVELL